MHDSSITPTSFQLERLEQRRLLAAFGTAGLSPALSDVYCDYFGSNPRVVQTSVDQAVDFWLAWADDWLEALADDIEDGFFGGNFSFLGSDYAQFLRDTLPANNASFGDAFRDTFNQFGGFIITSGGGSSRGALASFGGVDSSVSTPSRDRAAAYEGGLFNTGGSGGSLEGGDVAAVTSLGNVGGGGEVPAAQFSDTPTSATGGFYGGGYG